MYDGGDNGVTTEHLKVYGGDHDWPGVWGNMDIHASIEVWKFFSKYDINGLIAGVDETTIVDEIKVFPNPATDLISIHMEASEDLSYEITSTNGKYIQDGVITVSNQWIDVSKLTPEMYFLKIEDKVLKFVVKR